MQNGSDRFEINFPNFSINQTDLTWFRPFLHVQNGRPLYRYGFCDPFDLPDRFGQILNYDETKKMTKLSTFERYGCVYSDRFRRRIWTSIFRPIWPTNLNKHIQTDLAEGFGQAYSDRFGRPIWTSIFRPIWPTDLDKYTQTDLSDGFRQVFSDRFGRPIWTSIFRLIWSTDSDKYIQTDLANRFWQAYWDGFAWPI